MTQAMVHQSLTTDVFGRRGAHQPEAKGFTSVPLEGEATSSRDTCAAPCTTLILRPHISNRESVWLPTSLFLRNFSRRSGRPRQHREDPALAGLPEEIFEAARIDGAGISSLLGDINLPMSLPIIATLAVLDFINAWNDFLWPFVAVNSESLRVLSVGLYLLRADTLGAGWGPLFAGYTNASIPLAVLFSPWASFTWKGWLNQA